MEGGGRDHPVWKAKGVGVGRRRIEGGFVEETVFVSSF